MPTGTAFLLTVTLPRSREVSTLLSDPPQPVRPRPSSATARAARERRSIVMVDVSRVVEVKRTGRGTRPRPAGVSDDQSRLVATSPPLRLPSAPQTPYG